MTSDTYFYTARPNHTVFTGIQDSEEQQKTLVKMTMSNLRKCRCLMLEGDRHPSNIPRNSLPIILNMNIHISNSLDMAFLPLYGQHLVYLALLKCTVFHETAETDAASHLWGTIRPEWIGDQMGNIIMHALELLLKTVLYLKTVNGERLVDYKINLVGWDQHWQGWRDFWIKVNCVCGSPRQSSLKFTNLKKWKSENSSPPPKWWWERNKCMQITSDTTRHTVSDPECYTANWKTCVWGDKRETQVN